MCTIHNIVKVFSDSTKFFWIFSDVLEWNLKSSGQLWDTNMKFEKFDADGNADFEDN